VGGPGGFRGGGCSNGGLPTAKAAVRGTGRDRVGGRGGDSGTREDASEPSSGGRGRDKGRGADPMEVSTESEEVTFGKDTDMQ